MLLAMDVGNTHTVLGLFSGSRLVRDWRIRTVRDGTADEYGVMVGNLLRNQHPGEGAVAGMVIANVVPPLDSVLKEMAATRFQLDPLFISAESLPGVTVRYREPRDVGADRVVNALAALERYAPPLIIVDFGTAITFDVINADGDYVGGAILPGIGISLSALFRNASRLLPVDLICPPSPVGKTTEESIQSGVFYGYASLVEGMVSRITAEVGPVSAVIATGGFAPLMSERIPVITEVDTHLTLRGLQIAYSRTKSKG